MIVDELINLIFILFNYCQELNFSQHFLMQLAVLPWVVYIRHMLMFCDNGRL